MKPRDAAPLVLGVAAALFLLPHVPPWAGMWLVAGAIFHGAKWMTWRDAVRAGVARSRARTVGWFLLWPGMDARAFFDEARRPAPPDLPEACLAVGKTAVGAAVLWDLARLAPSDDPLLRGWIGLLGTAWFLLFGLFHVLSVAWRVAGVDAPPIFRAPVFATSLGDFWGNRWNLAFRDLARRAMFGPLRRATGTPVAILVVFAVSGVAHDLVLSVPARGGYGLGTAYFLLQAAGLAFARSRAGRALGVRRGLCGWLYATAFTALPAPLLFHPPFVTAVYEPFLRVIGALPN
jgi:Membrane bound O-acyl transferase family